MKTLTGIGARILFAAPFAVFGLFHFMNTGGLTGVVPGWLPGPAFWVILTGIILVVCSISILFNWYGKVFALILAALLLIFILTIHIPGMMNPDMMRQAMSSLLKDTALMGGALTWAGILTGNGPKKEPASP